MIERIRSVKRNCVNIFLKNVKHVSRSTQTIALCGIKFFYEHTLQRTWHTLEFAQTAKEKKLPVVLSKLCTLSVEHFIQRFLQHILPKGFVKIRYFGFFASNQRSALSIVQTLLTKDSALPPAPLQAVSQLDPSSAAPISPNMLCPTCGKPMQFLRSLAPLAKRGVLHPCLVPHPSARSP